MNDAEAREQRQAEALRANLRRRKNQVRGDAAIDPKPEAADPSLPLPPADPR